MEDWEASPTQTHPRHKQYPSPILWTRRDIAHPRKNIDQRAGQSPRENCSPPPRGWCSCTVFIKLNNSWLLLIYLGCFFPFLLFKTIFNFNYILIIFFPFPNFSMILPPSLPPYPFNFQFFLKQQTKLNTAKNPPKPRKRQQ